VYHYPFNIKVIGISKMSAIESAIPVEMSKEIVNQNNSELHYNTDKSVRIKYMAISSKFHS
jgi:hypothetical protein